MNNYKTVTKEVKGRRMMSQRERQLHVLTTGRQTLDEVAAIVKRLPAELIDTLHIREKHRPARELVAWHGTLQELLPHTAIVINDRLDAALAAGASGVQLGAGSLAPAQARKLSPAGFMIGCSVHTPAEAWEAAKTGADYVIYGHVYASGSKPGLAPRGIQALAETVQTCSVPVIAIGGIEPTRVPEVLGAGAAGIAVLSSVLLHADPPGQLRAFRHSLDRAQLT